MESSGSKSEKSFYANKKISPTEKLIANLCASSATNFGPIPLKSYIEFKAPSLEYSATILQTVYDIAAKDGGVSRKQLLKLLPSVKSNLGFYLDN